MENFIWLKLEKTYFAKPTKVKMRKKKERNKCNGLERAFSSEIFAQPFKYSTLLLAAPQFISVCSSAHNCARTNTFTIAFAPVKKTGK